MNTEATILSLIADLYTQIQQLAAENERLRNALEQSSLAEPKDSKHDTYAEVHAQRRAASQLRTSTEGA